MGQLIVALKIDNSCYNLASFPGLRCFWLNEKLGGPGIFSHVHNVKGRKVVERT